ncbi:TonB-dependent receptor [Altererythrobacter xixiisoli]|uniref:TonB-dependent receptor n=1 Tax=Croceibacterium xixiisoli TaxID=1476466 RepID=A0A6I4TNQ0_9SPHN|nr:TonB-dependent receptor [Croceibacterium xixiisoli]MXO97574.1 TonB-dependent receptor [Croceibacterium xixiisoli]
MAALALGGSNGSGGGGPGGRRRKSPVTFGRVAVVVGVGLLAAVVYNMMSWQSVSDRPNEMKTTQVILPPPPPPPPPPPEVKPEEKPPEPVDAPPIDSPVDTPPPPDQAPSDATPSSDPAPGDNALTAREGAGPSNYGLAVGDGGGTRIGGRPGGGGGGDAHRAYANVALGCIRSAAQRDRDLSRGRYDAVLSVTMTPAGRIANARVAGVDDRRAAQIRNLLTGLQCQAPPAGLPVMRIELNARSGR